MKYLDSEFFEEFKSLDNLCRDIYGKSIDNKLGVTMYLEDMDRKAYQGSFMVSGWTSDYRSLKSARNMRNELAHSTNSFEADICSQEDIDFVRSFRTRILRQTDPLALLAKKSSKTRQTSNPQPKLYQQPNYTYTIPQKNPTGCFGIVASFFVVVACVIAFFI